MAKPVERICDINGGKELWKVSIRVHHKWNVIIHNKEHFEMIFVDKAGDDIHITRGASVGDNNKHDIPAKLLVFTGFSDIISGNYNKDVLIDVIAMIEGTTTTTL
ncbi:unnamed protein product [Vicia faba]|uniref:Replication protein A 70 kDa DNA-binding subunit B/D first OB fold domain-containing protein n=1 Tax=Vicia faba TaxID=3906 RepID=A0AAV0YDP3_VICFA|nr:unnamed protein product [Vicia faba]